MTYNLRKFFYVTALLGLFTACSDHDDAPAIVEEAVWDVKIATYSEDEDNDQPVVLSRLASYENIRVGISGVTGDTRRITVKTTDDWLTLATDTLANDSVVAFSTKENTQDQRRSATLIFADADHPQRQGRLTIMQASAADGDSNGEDARSELYVGYGYNVYAALDDPMSVRTTTPVIDMERVREEEARALYTLVHDSRLASLDVEYTVSNNIEAHGEDLAAAQTKDTENPIAGCVNDCQAQIDLIADNAKGKLDQLVFGRGTLKKAVASRVLDKGMLLYLRDQGKVPFSSEFNADLTRIVRRLTGEQRRLAIVDMLNKYGTHVVIQADLGGSIVYGFSMDSHATFNTKEEMEQEIEYTLGRITDGQRTGNKTTTSKKNALGAIKIHGGSPDMLKMLQNEVTAPGFKGQIDPAHLTDWLASIKYSDALTKDPALDVIHFGVIPMWDLVPESLRKEVLTEVMRMKSISAFKLPDEFLNTDIYQFDTKKDRTIFRFADNIAPTKSLCKLVFMGFENKKDLFNVENETGTPVLQICQEYVPKIRSDQRVVIVYPIYKQHIKLNQGLFIGDGIHQPAWVGFKDDDCYVNPITTLKPGDTVEKFYYVNGCLKLSNPTGLDRIKNPVRTVMDDCLVFYNDQDGENKTYNHPIVKIGSKFWTRYDINHRMLFAEDENKSSLDYVNDNTKICYTMFQWVPNLEFTKYNGWMWGYDPNKFYTDQPNMKWYVPVSKDIRDLYAYLGFNPKALFKGQVSGYEAQFNGYYGNSDIMNGGKYFSNRERTMHYQGELNIIASKNSGDVEDACLMVLNPDYTFTLLDNNSFRRAYARNWRENFYPVRPVRGYMYTYPTVTAYKRNER